MYLRASGTAHWGAGPLELSSKADRASEVSIGEH